MDYNFSITVPANTPESNPVVRRLTLTAGIVTEVRILFPPGCQGTTHVQIYDNGHQIWPLNPGGSYAYDATVLKLKESFELTTPPYELRVVAWNDDPVNDHTLTLGFSLLPIEPVLLSRLIRALLARPYRLA